MRAVAGLFGRVVSASLAAMLVASGTSVAGNEATRRAGMFAAAKSQSDSARKSASPELLRMLDADALEERTRVVGGAVIPLGYFRDAVAIVRSGEMSGLCTGVLVSRSAVLTAGHCICNLGIDRAPDKFIVVIGEDLNGTRTRVARAVLYDEAPCNSQKQRVGLDLGLLHLDRERIEDADVQPGPGLGLVFEPALRPRILPIGHAAAARLAPTSLYLSSAVQSLTIVGFGLDDIGLPGIKRYGIVGMVSRLCGTPLARGTFHCAAGREAVLAGPADTCSGDSGGPVYVVVGRDYYLAAIVSRAIDASGRCGPGGIYTLITPHVVNWIRSLVGAEAVAYD